MRGSLPFDNSVFEILHWLEWGTDDRNHAYCNLSFILFLHFWNLISITIFRWLWTSITNRLCRMSFYIPYIGVSFRIFHIILLQDQNIIITRIFSSKMYFQVPLRQHFFTFFFVVFSFDTCTAIVRVRQENFFLYPSSLHFATRSVFLDKSICICILF